MWMLYATNESERPRLFLTPGTMKTIGRGRTADYRVDAALTSRLHCRLSASDSALQVEDLGSTNGTFVNRQPIGSGPVALTPGDRLRIGRLELAVTRT